MDRYLVGGRGGGDTAGEPLCTLWNPSAVEVLYVLSFSVVSSGIALNGNIQRCTTRGSPGSTVTPDIDSDVRRVTAPNSGALLDLSNYTASPTLQTPIIKSLNHPARAGGGYELRFMKPIEVPPGTGLTFTDLAGVAGGMEFDVSWWE